jgi:DNA-binding NarL/FixJ family response regulator
MVNGKFRNLSSFTIEDRGFHHGGRRPGIFILSDFRVLCEGLVLALARQPSITIVGASGSPIPSADVARLRPDILLLDIATAGGLTRCTSLRELAPDVRIIAIGSAEVGDEIIACAKAGVMGFLSREASVKDVVTAAHCVMRGEVVWSPRVAALLLTRVGAMSAAASEGPGNGNKLTRREQEIVSLVSEGLSNKEIARALRIQNATVKNHMHSILSKLQVKRRAEVAIWLQRSDAVRPALREI